MISIPFGFAWIHFALLPYPNPYWIRILIRNRIRIQIRIGSVYKINNNDSNNNDLDSIWIC
jgi:hypothetical protein